jgi:hypothetical protein
VLPGGVSPRLEERCIVLDKWLKGRPTWKEVFERGLFNTKAKLKGKSNSPINLSTNLPVPPTGAGGDLSSSGERDKERERIVHRQRLGEKSQRSVSLRELFARFEKEWNDEAVAAGAAGRPAPSDLKERMRSSTDALEQLLQGRPSWVELLERGIGKDMKKDQQKKDKCKRTLRYLLRKRYRLAPEHHALPRHMLTLFARHTHTRTYTGRRRKCRRRRALASWTPILRSDSRSRPTTTALLLRAP